MSNNKDYWVNHYIEGFTEITKKTYVSRDMSHAREWTPFYGLFFINITSLPLAESSLTLKIVSPDLVNEIFNYKIKGIKGYDEKHFEYYPLSEYVEITNHPKISISIDDNLFIPESIEAEELNNILKSGKLSKPVYYFGKGLNSNENTLVILYILNVGANGVINIEFEYKANKIITKIDNYNYVFKYDLKMPGHTSKMKEFIGFEIPNEFVIVGANHKSNLITKLFKDSRNLRFKIDSLLDTAQPLEIEFSRNETTLFNLIKYLNFLFLIPFFLLMIHLTKKRLPFDVKLPYRVAVYVLTTVVIPTVFIKDNSANLFDAVIYTNSYIPFFSSFILAIAFEIFKINTPKNQI